MNTETVRKYKSNVVMQIIKVIQFCMVCCLEFYFAIFLLPLISAENLNNGTSAKYQYRLWKTISARLDVVTNISHASITPPVERDTILSIYNAYFLLCVHQNLRRSFYYILRNVGNHSISHTSIYIQRLNDSTNDRDDNDKQEDTIERIFPFNWCVEQYWRRQKLTLKSEQDIASVKNQHYCDDIFDIALCMIIAIFVEIFPLSMRFVCKNTVLCWRRLQLFCYSYHRNYAKTPHSRQQLQHQRKAVINCVCNVGNLSAIKWKKRSDQQQNELYILQTHFAVFSAITGNIFALSIQGAGLTDLCIPADAESVCATVVKLIFPPGVPAMVASAAFIKLKCKKSCQYYLLKVRLIHQKTFTTYAQILKYQGHYILISEENRLFPEEIAFLVCKIEQLKELDIICDYKHFSYGGDIKEKRFLFAASERKVCRISNGLLFQLLPLCHNLRGFAILQFCNQINNFLVTFPIIPKYGHDIVIHQIRCATLHINSKFQELKSISKQKSKQNSIKRLKPMKLTKPLSHWNVSYCSTNKVAYTFKCQRIKDNNLNCDAIIKFDLCCCCWCFYCYRRCNSNPERVSNSCCNRCCPWHRSQYTAKSPHCLYCYYYLHCYYCFNQCYCCCCYTQFATTTLMYPCSCLSHKSNHQLLKQKNTLPKMRQNVKETKQQTASQHLKCFRIFFRPVHPKNANYTCSTLSALHASHTIYWFQNTQRCCAQITKPSTGINTVKAACAETISNKKTDFINSIRCKAIYFGKCLYHKLINLADYLCRHIIIVLQVKISIPRSTALVIKVTREQQQQQQQMVNITHDQQLKMNNLCKIFCNNWKRHRRRRRRRRRRRMNKQEQQQHQSVQLQQQHINNEKETILSGVSNPRLHILGFNACKAIPTNDPVHMILSKAPTASMLATMRLANTKIAMTNGNRKDAISPHQTPALRLNRSRSRPNLVWLFIGLVWFEGPKYVNCSIHSSSQSPQSTSQAQSQTQTVQHTTQTTLQPLSTSTLHKIHPSRITSNLPLLTTNNKQIFKGSMSVMQKGSTAAMYKIKEEGNSNFNSKGIRSGNCLSSRRRASLMSTKTNGKHTRFYDIDPIVIVDRKRHDWLEPEAKIGTDFLDEEAHSAHSDRARLESIKRQILTKLGLKHKPNVSHPLPKQFIWDTIYRADGIRSVVSDFDFSENGSHQWELVSEVDDTKKTQRAHSVKANGITRLSLNFPGVQKGEFDKSLGSDAENVLNVNYKDYLHHGRFEESKILNDTKIPNNFTYLMHISNSKLNKDYLGVDEMGFSDMIYDDKADFLEIETDEINHQVNRGGNIVADTHADNNDGYSLHQQKYSMSTDQSKYESDDFLGDTQEFITFAEKGKMFKQHRLVEFSPQANGMPNQKLFVRKAEIHVRIDKLTTGRIGNSNRNNRGCGGKKTKPKLWIFQVMEKNTTKKSCDKSPQLCVTYDVDISNLGWQKFDITPTVRDWYRRAPTEKLRLLIDCTGCGKHYVLHLFNQPLVSSKQDLLYPQRGNRYRSVNRDDLVVQWTRQRLNGNNKLNDVRTKLFRPHPLLGYTEQSNRLQSKVPGTQDKRDIQYSQQKKYMHLKSPVSLELSPNRPFLVLRTETRILRRVRRRAIDCVGAMHGQCCKESFYVSFKALGWDDWIIAPRGYFANYCRGDCSGPFRTPDTFQTFHAHFIEEYRKMGLLNGMQPCCAPVKFSSMSLIYYGDDGIIKRDLPKMVVDECGCP
ncbi:uncharacterized protein LOC105219276 isoform X2 [Zeugodacus cucurbitae]|nr:uncharacterized protein LOC105219276 isoform X2 [Zeugodacus cucurbitae]